MYVTCPRCSQQNYATATQCAYCASPLTPAPQPAQAFAQTNAPGFAGGVTGGGGAGGGGTTGQPQIGQLIDRKYRIEKVLGQGGMGVVYLGHDVNADQKVVIKAILPEFANRGDFRERTLSEGKALAKIDHQNVVRFYSIVNHPETNELYIVMQFIEGESLDHTLERANASGQKLPIPEVVRIFKMALDGVHAAHVEGLMHRDLKPANIIVRQKDGVAKVMDFGIAKAEGATKGPTQAGGIVGSLFYMAPEQIKGARDLDKRLDVYAMGIVLYELVTGVVPFDGETEYDIMTQHISNPVPSVLHKRPDAPPWIDEVIAKATQKERQNRYQSCEEMRKAVDALDGGLAVPRSMTAYESSIADAGAPAKGGTAAMSAMPANQPSGAFPGPPGFPPPGTSSPGIPPAQAYEPPPKKGGSTGLVIGILAVLLIGGGVGGYFAFVHDDGKTAKADGNSGDKDKKGGDDKGDKKGDDKGDKKPDKKGDDDDKKPKKGDDDDKKKPAKKSPLAALVGEWKTDVTNRVLKAELSGDEVEFKVVDPAQWDGAFVKDEVRFKLKKGADDKTFEVVDRYRPAPPTGKTYNTGALASCVIESTAVAGKTLEATLKTDDQLEVMLATMGVDLTFDAGDATKVSSCKPKPASGTVKATLRKQK